MNTFENALDLLIAHEGGYVNDPNDPGGKTKFGISDRRDGNIDGMADLDGDGIGDVEIIDLELEQVAKIYRREYWERCKCDDLSPALATALFDTAVNCGNGLAARLLQRVLRVEDDGIIGPITIKHANKAEQAELVSLFLAERQIHNAALKTWKHYGRGWTKRVIKTGHYCLSLIK